MNRSSLKQNIRRRSRRGFTMVETLIVVAILVVLFAVALLALLNTRKNLRQKELDSKAEIIYVAAQNRLAELRASGYEDLYADTDGANGAQKLGYLPSDAASSNTDLDEDTLVFVRSEDKQTKGMAAYAVLPAACVDQELWAHNWYIEYDPLSASVYAVFYSEKAEIPEQLDSLRAKKARLRGGARIGYYGGDVALVETTSELRPDITIYNEEKLTAVFYCNNPAAREGEQNELTFEITLSDGKGGVLKRTVQHAELVPVNLRTYRYTWVLDSLDPAEQRFCEQVGGGFACGKTLNVTLRASSSSPLIDAKSASRDTNSLFAYEPKGAADTAYLAYGRHLQNLDQASKVDASITKAVQVSDISFHDDATSQTDWYSVYNDMPFTPIDNSCLRSFDGSSSLDGQTLYASIHGLHVADQGQEDAGLFRRAAGSICNVTLTGARIDGGNYVGAIAGLVSGELELSGCRVSLSQTQGDITDEAKAESAGEVRPWLRGKQTGGLLGRVSGTGSAKITGCLAATVIEAEEHAGGLVGETGCALQIEDSYADCYLSAPYTGGLVGWIYESETARIALSRVYAAGYQTAGRQAAGFAPGELDSLHSSYAAFDYAAQEDGLTVYSTAAGCRTAPQNVLYLSGFSELDTPMPGTQGMSFEALSGEEAVTALGADVFTLASGDATYAYNLLEQGLTTYSYPRLKALDHYGDWQARFESGSLVYYEVYWDEETKAYAYGFSGANKSTLRTGCTALGDGYALAYTDLPDEEIRYVFEGTEYTMDKAGAIRTADSAGTAYTLLPLPLAAVQEKHTDFARFYQQLIVSNRSFFFNPCTAKSVVVNDALPAMPQTVSIRTARQLYELSRDYAQYAPLAAGSQFQQELDIDYSTYLWDTYAGMDTAAEQTPITCRALGGFASVYDGGCRRIRGVGFAASDTQVGLFGAIARGALVKNVVLLARGEQTPADAEVCVRYFNSDGGAAASGSSLRIALGALAGENYGTVQNCAASGYRMRAYSYRSSTAYLGGLLGTNEGTVQFCSADTADVEIAATNAYVCAGGFTGRNRGSITASYALGSIRAIDADESTVWLAGFAADNNGGALRRCYSATALTASGTAESYGLAHVGGVAVGCFYLDGGTYAYAGGLYAYNTSTNQFSAQAAGTALTGELLADRGIAGFSWAQESYAHEETDEEAYPYPAVVTDAQGRTVHYGNWPIQKDIGTLGVFYWEYETGSSNSGYHFSYIGTNQGQLIGSEDQEEQLALLAAADETGEPGQKAEDLLQGHSLCVAHDDGGYIARYGYGYFYKTGNAEPTLTVQNCYGTDEQSALDEQASRSLAAQMPEYTFVAFRTTDTANTTGGLRLDGAAFNATWTLSYGAAASYTYSVSPFFAAAISLDRIETGAESAAQPEEAKPGSEKNPYQVRSAAQLQFINWNYGCLSAEYGIPNNTRAGGWTFDENSARFSYLVFSSDRQKAAGAKPLVWQQSHDIDAYKEYGAGPDGRTARLHVPIGSMVDIEGADKAKASAYIAFFTSTYDGQDYVIKNLEINSDLQCVGIFGITAAAKLRNIVMYTDRNNTVTGRSASVPNWYCMGGLVGFATRGDPEVFYDTSDSISNCTVSGYQILDLHSQDGGWGGGNIGGLVGATNINIQNCTAVNDIRISFTYTAIWNNIRVGGIAGVCRSEIHSCYAGGSIVSTVPGNVRANGQGVNIWTSGIASGVVLRCLGTMQDLIGSVEDVLRLYDCYSFVQLPKRISNQVAGSYSIASNGEMQSGNFQTAMDGYTIVNPHAEIYNCYALSSAVSATDDYLSFRDEQGWNSTSGVNLNNRSDANSKGDAWKRAIRCYNASTPYLSYEQMRDTGTDGLLSKLNRGYYGGFGTVTTVENGADISGKYSYPGGDTALKGLNYPFPTILTQTDAFGSTVSVHYGAWPRYGLLWEQSRAEFDLLADFDEQAQTPLLQKTLYVHGSGLAALDADQISFLDEDGNPLSEEQTPLRVYDITPTEGGFAVRFEGLFPSEAEVLVRVSAGGVQADMLVRVRAELKLAAEAGRVELREEETHTLRLLLTDSAGNPILPQPGRTLTWTLRQEKEDPDGPDIFDFADAEPAFNPETGTYDVPVTGFSAGSAILSVTCAYAYPLGTAEAGSTEMAATLRIEYTVTPADVFGLSFAGALTQVKLPSGRPASGAPELDLSGLGLCLFGSGGSFDGVTVTGAQLSWADGTDEDLPAAASGYFLSFGQAQSAGDYVLQTLTLSSPDGGARTQEAELVLFCRYAETDFTLRVTLPAEQTPEEAPDGKPEEKPDENQDPDESPDEDQNENPEEFPAQ